MATKVTQKSGAKCWQKPFWKSKPIPSSSPLPTCLQTHSKALHKVGEAAWLPFADEKLFFSKTPSSMWFEWSFWYFPPVCLVHKIMSLLPNSLIRKRITTWDLGQVITWLCCSTFPSFVLPTCYLMQGITMSLTVLLVKLGTLLVEACICTCTYPLSLEMNTQDFFHTPYINHWHFCAPAIWVLACIQYLLAWGCRCLLHIEGTASHQHVSPE